MAYLKVIVKLLVSGLILYFVFQKIAIDSVIEILREANIFYLILALIAFVLSQLISSFRLGYFWKAIKVDISNAYNWKLYLLGMYYNILLPGGIGGDGYKIYRLNQELGASKKSLFQALLFDRLVGLLGLFCLLCIGLSLVNLIPMSRFLFLSILPAIVVYYFIYKHWFPYFLPSLAPSFLLSLAIQLLQVLSAYMILISLHISGSILNYLSVFLLSSIAAVIPITFGGAGARELTFLYCASSFNIEANMAVSMSLIFYMISLLVSLSGIYYSFKLKN